MTSQYIIIKLLPTLRLVLGPPVYNNIKFRNKIIQLNSQNRSRYSRSISPTLWHPGDACPLYLK